jgi:hypothetical protein
MTAHELIVVGHSDASVLVWDLDLWQRPVELLDGFLFIEVERELEFGHDDQASFGKHPLEGGRNPFDLLCVREIPDDFSDLEDVA